MSDDFALHAVGTEPGRDSGRYHAALALDPDGNNVEAVFHVPVPAVETHP